MATNKHPQVIALAGGNGNLGRYLIEELCKEDHFTVIVLTRQVLLPSSSSHLTTNHQPETHPPKPTRLSKPHLSPNRLHPLLSPLHPHHHLRHNPHLRPQPPGTPVHPHPHGPSNRLPRLPALQTLHPLRLGRQRRRLPHHPAHVWAHARPVPGQTRADVWD